MTKGPRLCALAVVAGILGLVSRAATAGLVETIERIKPSVVMVGIFRKTGSPKFTLRGTGFVIGDGRTVATNAHVLSDLIEDGDASLVVLAAGRAPEQGLRPVRSWLVDKPHDLALLKIDGPAMPSLPLHDSAKVREGQAVAFTGFPLGGALGFAPVTHHGIVSSITPIALPSPNARDLKENVIRRLKGGSFDILQLDATAYPGNSGGPLFDTDSGEVVGIINMVLVKATKEAMLSHPSGISYAIPSNHLRDLLQQAR